MGEKYQGNPWNAIIMIHSYTHIKILIYIMDFALAVTLSRVLTRSVSLLDSLSVPCRLVSSTLSSLRPLAWGVGGMERERMPT